jgi:hypothetical protein
MPEKVRASPAGTPGCPQGRQAALGLLLPDPDDAEPPDAEPPEEGPPELLDDEEDEEPESEDEDEVPADAPADVPDSLLAAVVLVEDERLSVR